MTTESPHASVYHRLFAQSQRTNNSKFDAERYVREKTEEVKWRKRLDAQQLTTSPARAYYFGCLTQKVIDSPRLKRKVEPRPKSERIPSYKEVKRICNSARGSLFSVSAPVKQFPLPPVEDFSMKSISDKPLSKNLALVDMKLGFP